MLSSRAPVASLAARGLCTEFHARVGLEKRTKRASPFGSAKGLWTRPSTGPTSTSVITSTPSKTVRQQIVVPAHDIALTARSSVVGEPSRRPCSKPACAWEQDSLQEAGVSTVCVTEVSHRLRLCNKHPLSPTNKHHVAGMDRDDDGHAQAGSTRAVSSRSFAVGLFCRGR